MGNTNKYIITCRFPAWGYINNDEYPAFGVKYLIEVDIMKDPKRAFKKVYKLNMGKTFDGEILFVEEVDIVNLIN